MSKSKLLAGTVLAAVNKGPIAHEACVSVVPATVGQSKAITDAERMRRKKAKRAAKQSRKRNR